MVQRELLQTYKAKIYEQDDYIGVLKSETEYFKKKNAKYILRNVELERQIEELNTEVQTTVKYGKKILKESVEAERAKFKEMKSGCDTE